MKWRGYQTLVGLLLLLMFCAPVKAQQKGRDNSGIKVRGVLYPVEPDSKDQKRRPKPVSGTTKKPTSVVKTPPRPINVPPPVGLGYTIFMRKADGGIVRVNPNRGFYTDDQIRFMFEPGIDGYLYIIHQEGTNRPKLLFPRKELYKGNNYVRANTAVAIPSEAEPEPEHRWFVFKDSGALKTRRSRVIEHLTVVLSRDELDADADLILGGIASLKRDQLNVVTDVMSDGGVRITEREEKAIRTRDLDLGDAPEATVVVANFGTAPLLMTKIDLVHRARKQQD